MSKTKVLINELKEAGQDYEFYPTTNEIIKCLLEDIEDNSTNRYYSERSFVDVGAGNGKVLDAANQFEGVNFKTYAVERSTRLIQELVENHIVIGTEFRELNLSAILGDIVFCNPPYKEYSEWSTALLRHMPAKVVYLVIPERWINDSNIAEAINFSECKVKSIGSFSFENSEDRKARAKVQLIRCESTISTDDLLDKFISERYQGFDIAEEYNKEEEVGQASSHDEELRGLVKRLGRVPALVQMYNDELRNLMDHSDKIYSLDPSLLLSLGVDLTTIRTTLTHRINTLRDKYWKELFTSLDTIRARLTEKNQNIFASRITAQQRVEFTALNIYALVCYVLKQANSYTESQTIDVFNSLTCQASVESYKSNEKVFGKTGDENNWRYGTRPCGLSHYKLDFRIILCTYSRGLAKVTFGEGIHLVKNGATQIADILTVLRSLGYDVNPSDPRLCENEYNASEYWESKKSQVFEDSQGNTVLEVKAFLNGNLHLRFAPRAILDLSVAAGRYHGWLKSPEQAAEEFNDPQAAESFHRAQSALLTFQSVPLGIE